ncbi:hypothetical protein [Paenibacillus amylolyticus]
MRSLRTFAKRRLAPYSPPVPSQICLLPAKRLRMVVAAPARSAGHR